MEKINRKRQMLTALLALILTIGGVGNGMRTVFAETRQEASGTLATDSNVHEKRPFTAKELELMSGSNTRPKVSTGSDARPKVSTGSNAEGYSIDGDGISVSVVFSGDVNIPDGAEFKVTRVTDDSFSDLFQIFRQKWDGKQDNLKIYNIGFYKDEEEIEVEAEAVITVHFPEGEFLNAADGLAVLHFKDGDVETLDILNPQEVGEGTEVSELQFKTNSFSDFGILEQSLIPSAGGTGTRMYTIIGVCILIIAVVFFVISRRKDKK